MLQIINILFISLISLQVSANAFPEIVSNAQIEVKLDKNKSALLILEEKEVGPLNELVLFFKNNSSKDLFSVNKQRTVFEFSSLENDLNIKCTSNLKDNTYCEFEFTESDLGRQTKRNFIDEDRFRYYSNTRNTEALYSMSRPNKISMFKVYKNKDEYIEFYFDKYQVELRYNTKAIR
jgi:hypothetical protein